MVAFLTDVFEGGHGVGLAGMSRIISKVRFTSQLPANGSQQTWSEDKSFVIRISLEAQFPDDYDGPHDERAWLREWETQIKPVLIKNLFDTLRDYPAWKSHVRNRGISPTDEIEVAMVRDFSSAS